MFTQKLFCVATENKFKKRKTVAGRNGRSSKYLSLKMLIEENLK
uniref:Uncharacterized protein n=1 Tax=Meloidogyne enterolobii TaxID=390850 RepID=A0A6V7TZD0_MELEN|nr:unnamed protein product [Meloidogyne enterolobii]